MSIEKVEIGLATLYLGDCLEVVKQLETMYDHTISDPPYEAEAHTAFRQTNSGEGLVVKSFEFEAMDEMTRKAITQHIVDKTEGWSLFFCQVEANHFWRMAIEEAGGKYFSTMAWVKPDGKPNFKGNGPGIGFENIVVGWCGEGKSVWNGGGKTGVFVVNKNEDKASGNTHMTIKPQKLMLQLVELFTNKGQLIFDPFMGSGSTGVSAVGTGRRFIGVERNPEHFETCCRRIEDAQKGMFHTPYVKTKARVNVALFPESPKVAAPKPRGAPNPKKAAQPKGSKAAKARFAAPTIEVDEEPEEPRVRKPLESPLIAIEKKYGDRLINFGPWDNEPGSGGAVGMDVECFKNFFLVNFERFGNGQRASFEMSDRSEFDAEAVKRIILNECIIGFNSMNYDLPMLTKAIRGTEPYELKEFSNEIIRGEVKHWQMEERYGVQVPIINHVDLFEPNPAVKMGLKTLAGRLHARTIMDLPYPHDSRLTHMQMNVATVYCFYDLDATKVLLNALREPLALRVALGKQYGLDLRSKSDAQVGEAIVKKRVEQLTKRKVRKANDIGSFFNYEIPSFFSFEHPDILKAVEIIKRTEFSVNGAGRVEMPKELEDLQIRIGASTYTMGIGGLHSTEANRAVLSDNENILIDLDVASQYPRIILRLGMFPKALGEAFLRVYKALVDERVDAKRMAQIITKEKLPKALGDEIEKLKKELIEATVKAEGGKIAANGIFGKLLSFYSVLYAPHMGIATTLTGQLSLLMIIDMCERNGIPVVSGNTDGVVLRCPRSLVEFDDKKNIVGGRLREILTEWETATGFEFESNLYKGIYNSSVNTYIAIKEDGGHKRKGPIAAPHTDGDRRGQMMKNPQMEICSNAVLALIKNGTPLKETIEASKDMRDFVTVVKAKGGGMWRGEYLGQVVRYYWSTDCDPILYKSNGRKVAKTDGARPLMEMDGSLPDDIDYERYVREAEKIAEDIGIEQSLLKEMT